MRPQFCAESTQPLPGVGTKYGVKSCRSKMVWLRSTMSYVKNCANKSREDGVGGYAFEAVIPQIWSEVAKLSRRLFTVEVRRIQPTLDASPGATDVAGSVAAAANFGRSREDYDHVIVLVHGIRDIGAWQLRVSRSLDHPGTTTKQVRYGLYPAVRFLFPINLSGGPVRKVTQALNDLKYEYPKARISVIAHSFGTYVVLKALERDPNLQLWKLIFCGSVANDQLRWSELKRRIGDGKRPTCDFIVNDCGTGDRWPVLGAAFGWFYGTAGATGFSEGFVTNRFHRARGGASGGHGLYFNPDFVTEKWRPFLIEDAEPAPGDGEQGEHLPSWVKLLYNGWARWVCRCVMLVFWLSVLAAAAGAIWWAAAWGYQAVVARAGMQE